MIIFGGELTGNSSVTFGSRRISLVLIIVTIRRNRETWQTLRSREPQPCDLMLRIALFILAPVIATG